MRGRFLLQGAALIVAGCQCASGPKPVTVETLSTTYSRVTYSQMAPTGSPGSQSGSASRVAHLAHHTTMPSPTPLAKASAKVESKVKPSSSPQPSPARIKVKASPSPLSSATPTRITVGTKSKVASSHPASSPTAKTLSLSQSSGGLFGFLKAWFHPSVSKPVAPKPSPTPKARPASSPEELRSFIETTETTTVLSSKPTAAPDGEIKPNP